MELCERFAVRPGRERRVRRASDNMLTRTNWPAATPAAAAAAAIAVVVDRGARFEFS